MKSGHKREYKRLKREERLDIVTKMQKNKEEKREKQKGEVRYTQERKKEEDE